jgi:multidrug resistance protein MdtO
VAIVEFLAKELAPSHRRFIEATRTALKSTLTAGIAATLQILGPFGPLFAFRIGQPGISLGLFEGGLTILTAAAVQAAIVPITGKLLEYPGLIMTFLFVVFASLGYLLAANPKLFLILGLVAIGTITTVYAGIFQPGQIGWGSTYTFDGILAATLVMVVIDTLIWPSPPEPKLLESVARDLERSRRRLEMVGRHYLDPAAAPLPATEIASRLAPHLALLKSIQGGTAPQRFAHLLNAVMTTERVFLEVERLAVIAEEPLPDELRQRYGNRVEEALGSIDAALARRSEEIRSGLHDPAGPARSGADLRFVVRSAAVGGSNLAGFVGALEVIENLLEPPPVRIEVAGPSGAEDSAESRPRIDPDRLRYAVKLGATIVLGLLVGLTTQRADLQTILWSIVVAGGPNQYGAVVRKTLLRLAGCIVGGIAVLGAMILVSQNFDSLPAYMVAIFMVSLFAAYVAQSSDWLNYVGIQTGVTFLICYVAMGPSSDVYKPLWRFWGIVLGVLTNGFVFLLLWPEYAGDKVTDSLAKLMKTSLAFAREVAEGTITEGRIAGLAQGLSANLLQVLNFADQARLEGQRGREISASGFDAAATVIRIAYRFEVIARPHLSRAEVALPGDVIQFCASREREFCHALESRVEILESLKSADLTALRTLRAESSDVAPAMAALFEDYDLNAQLESYRRLPILLKLSM